MPVHRLLHSVRKVTRSIFGVHHPQVFSRLTRQLRILISAKKLVWGPYSRGYKAAMTAPLRQRLV
jgi:hypothetical protein